MIYIDPSELREGSLLADLGSLPHEPLHDLEAWTGADMLITHHAFPASTEALVRQHIALGAILVQRKSGLDLVHSVGERMGSSLARMRATGARQAQCVLLFIGVLTCNHDDKAVVDGRETSVPFWAVQGAISKWHDRGGVFESISRAKLTGDWLRMKQKHLTEYAQEPVHSVWPTKPEMTDTNNPLQVPQLVQDGRVTLATLPGLGPTRANALWDYAPNLAELLCLLTTPSSKVTDINGIGPKTIANIRAYLGLDDVMQLTLEVLPEYAK